VADLETRVLVRLDESIPRTVERIDVALAQAASGRRAVAPGCRATLEALRALERRGQARQLDGGWVLSAAGVRAYNTLEDRYENSGQRGDYGF
jgi:hypothetical protein